MSHKPPDKAVLFDRLYKDHASRVTGFLLRLTGGRRAEAEDLTQETFLAAYEGWEAFSRRGRPLPWLLGIAWRRWRDRARRQAETLPLIEEQIPTIDDLEERTISAAVLQSALSRLDEPARDALLLVAVQGLTYREAARVLGEPEGTVKWRVHEASRRLRRLLAGAFQEEKKEVRHEQSAITERSGHNARLRRASQPAPDTPYSG